MNIEIEPGTYIVAVSGGVDSIVLLDLLAGLSADKKRAHHNHPDFSTPSSQLPAPNYQFVVAHFDHGIRADSAVDRELVQKIAAKYKLPFEFAEGHLGADASESFARDARYAFLGSLQKKYNAKAIITAHHQDDVLETVILNVIRGTNRKGLTSLRSRTEVVRPMLSTPKAEIIQYAEQHALVWHEDSTNQDEKYLRNYIRHSIMPRLGASRKQMLLDEIERLIPINDEIDTELIKILQSDAPSSIERAHFVRLPHAVAKEVLLAFLKLHQVTDIDTKTIERLVIAAKTAQPGAVHDIRGGWQLRVLPKTLAIQRLER